MIKPYKIIETYEEALNKAEQPKVAVTDMDEVLVNISPKTFQLIRKNENFFNKYLNLDRVYTTQEILLRDTFHMEKWLAREEYKDNIPKECSDKFYSLFDDDTFYDDLIQTRVCDNLNDFANSKTCEKLIIASHCVGENQTKSKIKFLKRVFGKNPKIQFMPIDISVSKSKAIMDNNIKWNTFIDDNLDVIYDVIRNTESFGNEIIIPQLGYNLPTQRLYDLCKYFSLELYYISKFEKMNKKVDIDNIITFDGE